MQYLKYKENGNVVKVINIELSTITKEIIIICEFEGEIFRERFSSLDDLYDKYEVIKK